MNGIKVAAYGTPGAPTKEEVNSYLRSFIRKPETLQDLLKLSGQELFMASKLDVLKTISNEHYKIKYKEYFGVEPNDAGKLTAQHIQDEINLNALLKLTGHELYMQGKFEDLKALSQADYFIKYNEFIASHKSNN